MTGLSETDVGAIAQEAAAAWGTGRQIGRFSDRYPSFDLADAYRVTAEVRRHREAAGARVVGRKIGFTNRTIWVEPPMWGYVYDGTVDDLASPVGDIALAGFAAPRIEPEIVFGLRAAPSPGSTPVDLLACIDWIAHGFEIVQSIFPGWRFSGADAVAGYGLHGALLIGRRHTIEDRTATWDQELATFEIELLRDGVVADRGRAANVMGGPLVALAHLVDLLAADPASPPLAAGEIVTTGTLTDALPIAAGETWSTRFTGIALDGASLSFQ